MIRTPRIAAGVTLLTFTTACTIPPAPPPPPEPPLRYYSAAAVHEQTEVRTAASDGGVLTQDASKLLHTGIKVAFYPPNECVTTPSEAGTGAVRQGELIVLHCGALMSRLEAQAARAGFEVVSWQAIKHRERPPLELARELGVDVVFELNELSIVDRDLGTVQATHLRFGQETGPGDRVDVPVGPDVARRCQGVLEPELAKRAPKSFEAVVDAKAVDVRSGRALWFYKRATPEPLGPHTGRGLSLFYPAAGTVDWTPPPPAKPNGLQFAGAAMLFPSLPLTLTSPVLIGLGKSDGDADMTRAGNVMLGVGLALLVGGAVLLALGNARQRRVPPPVYPRPTYPPPEDVLCAMPPAVPPWHVAAPPVAAGTSADYTLTDTTPGGRDIERERRERLVQGAADEFIAELSRVSTGR